MLTLPSRCTDAARRLCRDAAIAATWAAVGCAIFVWARSDTERERTLPEPARSSEFWDKPKPRCLHCHRQGDYRLDPSRRTAYARFMAIGVDPVASGQSGFPVEIDDGG